MTSAAIFQGAYTDLKFVKTRSVCQVIVELPIERAADFVAAFGAPLPGAEIPVALARIDPKKPASEPRNAPDKASAPRERQKFSTMPLSAQAAIRCDDPDFRRFLGDRLGSYIAVQPDDAANEVRQICGVISRSKISDSDRSGEKWRALDAEYQNWKHSVPSYEGVATR